MPDSPAWIDVIPPDEWRGDLREHLPAASDPATGRVDHIMQVHSLAPAGLAAHIGLYTHAMAGTPGLRKVDREMVALVVSTVNHCHY